jgi:hypothetical protein
MQPYLESLLYQVVHLLHSHGMQCILRTFRPNFSFTCKRIWIFFFTRMWTVLILLLKPCLRPLFWSNRTHDLMDAVSIAPKCLLQEADPHSQATIITYDFGAPNASIWYNSVMDGVQNLHKGRGPYACISYIQYVPLSHLVFCSSKHLRNVVLCSVSLQ